MNRKTKQILVRIIGIVLLILLAFYINLTRALPTKEVATHVQRFDIMEVHFIDVGQGDAILIESDHAAMLIDAGENNKGTVVADYLQAQSITKLDYVIGTHPHSDHIGGLDTIINKFQVDHVILPYVSHTTKTFEDVLTSIEKKNLKITKPVVGSEFDLGSGTFSVVAPNDSSYEEMNNYSVGIKLTYGATSFLFTGDAEKLAENDMLNNGLDLSADVLKLSHHGSAYSSSDPFLDAVDPTYAIVSAGKDNEYGHPHASTLQSMLDRNIKLYRSDEQGTVVFTSDGKTISVNTEDYKITASDLDE